MSTQTHNVQTTVIPAGGAAIAEIKLTVPGTFIIVDHSLTRAFNRGALAMLKVAGPEQKDIYSGKTGDFVYLPEGAGARVADQPTAVAPVAKDKTARIKAGRSRIRQQLRGLPPDQTVKAFPTLSRRSPIPVFSLAARSAPSRPSAAAETASWCEWQDV